MNFIKLSFFTALSLLGLSLLPAAEPASPSALPAGQNMYVIERDMPAVGELNAEQLKAASMKSCAVLKELGPDISWQYSFVTSNKIYCVYLAPSIDIVKEHAKKAGFPADAVNRVVTIISPKTAE